VTLDLVTIKKRRATMMVVNVLAALIAVVSIVGYFMFAVSWALVPFIAALLAGFAAQIWFIAGLKGPGVSQTISERDARSDGGV
jgi:CHASE2 domain-containing sensor protein